jgi:hypothetical protein
MQLRASGDQAGAAAALRTYLDTAPQAGDAAVVRHYLDKLEATP